MELSYYRTIPEEHLADLVDHLEPVLIELNFNTNNYELVQPTLNRLTGVINDDELVINGEEVQLKCSPTAMALNSLNCTFQSSVYDNQIFSFQIVQK